MARTKLRSSHSRLLRTEMLSASVFTSWGIDRAVGNEIKDRRTTQPGSCPVKFRKPVIPYTSVLLAEECNQLFGTRD